MEAIIAPISKFKKQNALVLVAVFIIAGIWFAKDGYYNEKFMREHSSEDGIPDQTLVFNQKSPPFFAAGALAMLGYFFATKSRRLIADDDKLSINAKINIPYDKIEKIDKTYFDNKGYFLRQFHIDKLFLLFHHSYSYKNQ